MAWAAYGVVVLLSVTLAVEAWLYLRKDHDDAEVD